MAYCARCGNDLPAGASFCDGCGYRVSESGEKCPICGEIVALGAKKCICCGYLFGEPVDSSIDRRSTYEGVIHKCPSCGERVDSFSIRCAACGCELRDSESSNVISEFVRRLDMCRNNGEKINLIKSFPIPNTKEDIAEFMILAFTNFDANYYVEHLNEDDVSDAWLVKIEQCYQKAQMLFSPTDSELKSFEKMYDKINESISNGKKKRTKKIVLCVILVVGLLMLMALPYALPWFLI